MISDYYKKYGEAARTNCCKAKIINKGSFKNKFICVSCEKENPEFYNLPTWEEVGFNLYKISVEGGWLYKVYYSKTYPGGTDRVPVIQFIKEINHEK